MYWTSNSKFSGLAQTIVESLNKKTVSRIQILKKWQPWNNQLTAKSCGPFEIWRIILPGAILKSISI